VFASPPTKESHRFKFRSQETMKNQEIRKCPNLSSREALATKQSRGIATFCLLVIASPAKPGVAIPLDCFFTPQGGASRNDKTYHCQKFGSWFPGF
jgi:hypothetical protein